MFVFVLELVGCFVVLSRPSSMVSGISILNHFAFKVLLQHISVSGTDSFVVIFFQIDDFEAELFVELDRAFVVHLDVSEREESWSGAGEIERWRNLQENVIKISVSLLDILEDVVQHDGSDAEPTVRVETAEGHDVEPPLIGDSVDSAADRAYDDIIVISELCEFPRFQYVQVEAIVVRDRKSKMKKVKTQISRGKKSLEATHTTELIFFSCFKLWCVQSPSSMTLVLQYKQAN